jgi:hypothetical protein
MYFGSNAMAIQLWVGEYSLSQDAFNTDSLSRALDTNKDLTQQKKNNDYQIFGIFKTLEEADLACDEMRKKQGENT